MREGQGGGFQTQPGGCRADRAGPPPSSRRKATQRNPATPPRHRRRDELAQLHWLIETQRSIFSTQLRDFDRSAGYAPSGALSAAAWLRWECRLAPSAAAEQVRVARALPQLPETAQTFAQGQICFQHAALISRSAEEVGLAVVQEAQPALLEAARRLDPHRLRLVTRHLRYCLDPEGAQA
ncbi:MAG: 13E12 repeat family protein, partial [Candidatus Dormibacteraeota bacterium]|nr:13E12 repeat family protein [Candidatus Dormibacteraeota bacterium]